MVDADLRLYLFPDGFGSRKRMIAVAHREEQYRLSFVDTIFGSECLRFRKTAQGFDNLIFQFIAHCITGEMTAIQHQLKIV
jgi:hypothetical protein